MRVVAPDAGRSDTSSDLVRVVLSDAQVSVRNNPLETGGWSATKRGVRTSCALALQTAISVGDKVGPEVGIAVG